MATTTKSVSGVGNGRSQKQRPIFTKTYFPVQLVVFEHTNDNGRKNYSCKVSRSFRRDDQSDWETSEYLGTADLLPAARLLAEAYDVIQQRHEDAYRERNESVE